MSRQKVFFQLLDWPKTYSCETHLGLIWATFGTRGWALALPSLLWLFSWTRRCDVAQRKPKMGRCWCPETLTEASDKQSNVWLLWIKLKKDEKEMMQIVNLVLYFVHFCRKQNHHQAPKEQQNFSVAQKTFGVCQHLVCFLTIKFLMKNWENFF